MKVLRVMAISCGMLLTGCGASAAVARPSVASVATAPAAAPLPVTVVAVTTATVTSSVPVTVVTVTTATVTRSVVSSVFVSESSAGVAVSAPAKIEPDAMDCSVLGAVIEVLAQGIFVTGPKDSTSWTSAQWSQAVGELLGFRAGIRTAGQDLSRVAAREIWASAGVAAGHAADDAEAHDSSNYVSEMISVAQLASDALKASGC